MLILDAQPILIYYDDETKHEILKKDYASIFESDRHTECPVANYSISRSEADRGGEIIYDSELANDLAARPMIYKDENETI